jgi:hypothetical protein
MLVSLYACAAAAAFPCKESKTMSRLIRYAILCLIPAGALATPPALTGMSVGSLDEDSDYSGVFADDVDPELRREALRSWFQSPKFNVRDEMSEYSRDYHEFTPLGDVETADMKHRALRLLEQEAGESVVASQTWPDTQEE